MKIAICGLWHLGLVTAASLAKHYSVIAYDDNPLLIDQLNQYQLPIYEPGLTELIKETHAEKKLSFTNDVNCFHEAEIVWITYDTPVNEDDEADVETVVKNIKHHLNFLNEGALIIISSQLPAGSAQDLIHFSQQHYPEKKLSFAVIPENLRLGNALTVFNHPDRIIIGLNDHAQQHKLSHLFVPFTDNLIFMSIASAEMTKHAINTFLAMSITYINEIANLCEKVGANAYEVEAGLKSEARIGKNAYLHPGGAIGGGTLLRDLHYLQKLCHEHQLPGYLISALDKSNAYHREWMLRKLNDLLPHLQYKTIAVLGLTYKPNTNTLRRSPSLQICAYLHEKGAKIKAYDPAIKALPNDYAHIETTNQSIQSLNAADCVLIGTEWPDFLNLRAEDFISHMLRPLVIDPSGFLALNLKQDSRIEYHAVGVNQ